MRRLKTILIALAVIVVSGVCLVSWVYVFTAPTKGQRIAEYASVKKALLVIDIQEDFTGTTAKPPFPYEDCDKTIATVNELIDKAHSENVIVVYLKQEFVGFFGTIYSKIFCKGAVIKGRPGTAADKRISIVTDYVYSKSKGDAFSSPEFERCLITNEVNELYLVGLDAEFCIYYTAKGALNRGYKVNIITDGIFLLDEKKRDGLFQKYKNDGIILITSSECINGSF
jgi:nicotinamidase-related amidase